MKRLSVLILSVLLLSTSLCSAASDNLMLPKSYKNQELQGEWLWSEKLDGIRGEWTGTEMLTKQGNKLEVPAHFIKNFPNFPLSGEIWGGRGTYQSTSSITSTVGEDKGWETLRFGIFDSRDNTLEIEERLAKAKAWFDANPSKYAFIIKQTPVKSKEELQSVLTAVVKGGGEGLIVIKKGSMYKGGRTIDVLKVKQFDDTEGIVLKHIPGKGNNAGRLGSLYVALQSDPSIKFKIGTGFKDADRDNPPPIGSVVTFKYTGFYKSGKPKFCSFLRIRNPE